MGIMKTFSGFFFNKTCIIQNLYRNSNIQIKCTKNQVKREFDGNSKCDKTIMLVICASFWGKLSGDVFNI